MNMLDFSLFMDLHNHTIWSDGDDKPEEIILNAINHQVEVVGITDHFCQDGKCSLGLEKIRYYLDKIDKQREKYNDKIKVLIGIEVAYGYLIKNHKLLPYDILNKLDYILLEDLDYIPVATPLEEVTLLLEGFECSKGLAHTDLIQLAEKYRDKGSLDYVLDFVKQNGLFWEINTSSAHDVFLDILSFSGDHKVRKLIEGIKARGIPVSVGSDTHSLVQYDFGRLKVANELAKSLNACD